MLQGKGGGGLIGGGKGGPPLTVSALVNDRGKGTNPFVLHSHIGLPATTGIHIHHLAKGREGKGQRGGFKGHADSVGWLHEEGKSYQNRTRGFGIIFLFFFFFSRLTSQRLAADCVPAGRGAPTYLLCSLLTM